MARDVTSGAHPAHAPDGEREERDPCVERLRGDGCAELAFVGLGSNLGDRRANILRALSLLESEGPIEVLRVSQLRETDPVGGPPQGRYLNGAAEVRTTLAPRTLLAACLRVEAALGRVRSVRNGPRTIDLDILLHGSRVIRDADLEIPHPRLLERRFALEPLAELAPDRIHPVTGRTLGDHLRALEATEART